MDYDELLQDLKDQLLNIVSGMAGESSSVVDEVNDILINLLQVHREIVVDDIRKTIQDYYKEIMR